jgi:hypothetical protein
MKQQKEEQPQGGILSILTFIISVAVIIYAIKIVLM